MTLGYLRLGIIAKAVVDQLVRVYQIYLLVRLLALPLLGGEVRPYT